MFEGLFISSLPKIDVSDRIERTFLGRHEKRFKPKEEKDVTLFNAESVRSKYSQELKFTNYISDKTQHSIPSRLLQLAENLNLIKENGSFDPITFNTERIAQVIKLYLKDFNPEELEEDQIMKVSLFDPFGKKEGIRVYFILNNSLNSYEVILIDIFHLLIPSKHKSKKGKLISKDKMLNITFEENRNNKHCISNFFHVAEKA